MINERELDSGSLQVPDDGRRFEVFGRMDYPCTCVGYVHPSHKTMFLKIADPRSARHEETQVLADTGDSNSLLNSTSFSIKPRYLSVSRVIMLAAQRIGTHSEVDLRKMQTEFVYLLGQED